jgi:hypothetical protein
VFQSDACGRTPLYHLLKLRPTVRSLRIIYERDNYALTTPDFCGISPTALVYFREYPIYELKTLLNLHPESYKGVKGGVMNSAKALAKKRLDELMEHTEVFMSTNPNVYDYSIGRTEARENPAQSKPFDEEAWKSHAATRAHQSK